MNWTFKNLFSPKRDLRVHFDLNKFLNFYWDQKLKNSRLNIIPLEPNIVSCDAILSRSACHEYKVSCFKWKMYCAVPLTSISHENHIIVSKYVIGSKLAMMAISLSDHPKTIIHVVDMGPKVFQQQYCMNAIIENKNKI